MAEFAFESDNGLEKWGVMVISKFLNYFGDLMTKGLNGDFLTGRTLFHYYRF